MVKTCGFLIFIIVFIITPLIVRRWQKLSLGATELYLLITGSFIGYKTFEEAIFKLCEIGSVINGNIIRYLTKLDKVGKLKIILMLRMEGACAKTGIGIEREVSRFSISCDLKSVYYDVGKRAIISKLMILPLTADDEEIRICGGHRALSEASR